MPSAQASISEAGTFCDITRLLQELTRPKCVAQAPKHNGKGEYTDDEILVENDIPDMVLSEDDDDPGDEFEIVKYEPMSEHNGTVRRWYRGFRH
ncbi:hypothetical protein CC86DRAFT_370465 [Ophiobolus disseminans]|uniref:Uncharacterized protein n=1 Tax=Ophiobolus disseminans TaxID=1469910 RepID=A0A6A6ZZP7_9PLEO|nr:hypothetical protein CC86DRAFT_370465 [Ophiobolus disseminans]